MARPLVVDASVAAKWVLREVGSSDAARILDAFRRGHLSVFAPSLLVEEVAAVIATRFRRNLLNSRQAVEAFEQMLIYLPTLVRSNDVARSAMRLATQHRASFYDCLYLAWSFELKCDLVTADARFFRSLNNSYTHVTMLGAFRIH